MLTFNIKYCLFLLFIVYVLAFDDIYVNGELSNEIIEKGRAQYQLLKERGNLPQYGDCWKSAVGHVNDGCKYLSEETQSDIALHLTNCFLSMSGHETYNCDLDKKPNLRGICINSMSDRAFNVYTEFYTHAQNMCWFLRGQIWHETISENTYKLTKELELSAQNQEQLLKSQEESLKLQEKILKHGQLLEEVLEQLYTSSEAHQKILGVMSESMSSFHSWVVGEISWFDSLAFYIVSLLLIILITSTKRTASSRLMMFFILILNFLLERFIWFSAKPYLQSTSSDNTLTYEDVLKFIRFCRGWCVFLNGFYLICKFLLYRDLIAENNQYLSNINEQNREILDVVNKIKRHLKMNHSMNQSDIQFINESLPEIQSKNDSKYSNGFVNRINFETNNNISSGNTNGIKSNSNLLSFHFEDASIIDNTKNLKTVSNKKMFNNNLNEKTNGLSPKTIPKLSERYNLRNKSRTPDLNV